MLVKGIYSVLLRGILQRRMFPAYDGLAASSIVGFGFPFGLFGRGQAMEGPGLGHRGREASLCNPTGFQVGSGADRESLGVGRIPVYQWRSTSL